MELDEGSDAEDDSLAESAAPEGDAAGSAPDTALASTTTAQGFFPDEEAAKERDAARLDLPSVPTQAELDELARGSLLSPTLSFCGPLLEPEPGLSLIGVVPISVDDRQGEVLVYATEDGSGPSLIVVSTELIGGIPACTPME
jgi:hypothetical protein